MRSASVILFAGAVLGAATLQASTDDWSRYDNPRFAYTIDVPPGFSALSEAENGDGGVASSADGKAELRVWGANLVDRDFGVDIADRVRSDASEGWAISYDRRTADKASWSGSRKDRVFYARAVEGCDGAAIYFRLEHDRSQLKLYDAVVSRLVKSLRGTC